MQHVFTYGSLMFEPVWSRVVHGGYASRPATLRGFQRLAVKGEEYPVAVPASPHSGISGVLYLDVQAGDIARLDAFEGEYYVRQKQPVTTETGEILTAGVYILKNRYRQIAANSAWDAEAFAAHGIQRFLARYRGFG